MAVAFRFNVALQIAAFGVLVVQQLVALFSVPLEGKKGFSLILLANLGILAGQKIPCTQQPCADARRAGLLLGLCARLLPFIQLAAFFAMAQLHDIALFMERAQPMGGYPLGFTNM